MYEYDCAVLRVVDGDTLDILIDLGFNIRIRERIRLLGIDAPEMFGKDWGSEPGLAAKAYVEKWVSDHLDAGRSFRYHSVTHNYRDIYSRSIGDLLPVNENGVSTTTLTDDMVAAGHAVWSTY